MNHPKCLFPSPKTFPLPGVSERNTAVAGWAWGITGQQFLLWPSLAPQHLYSETQSDPLRLLPRLSKSHYSIFVLLHTTNYSHDLQVSCLLRYTLSQILAMPGHWHSREAAGTLHSCLYFLPSLPVSFLQTSHVSPVQREGLDPMAMLLVIKLLLWLEDGSNWAVSFTREIYHFWWAHRQSSETEIPFATICCCCPFFKDLVKAR